MCYFTCVNTYFLHIYIYVLCGLIDSNYKVRSASCIDIANAIDRQLRKRNDNNFNNIKKKKQLL